MRLATIETSGGATSAVVVFDGRPVPVDGYADVGELLRDPAGLEAARSKRPEDAATAAPVTQAQLRRPVLAPSAVVCVGLNYRSHILEMGRELPTSPTLFAKLPRAMTDPYADITIPTVSQKVDYEAELAVVIGRGGSSIPVSDAWEHVAGLTILNDVSMRDYQQRTVQFFAGKTFQASTPWGPWIVTPDELGDLHDKRIRLTVNGQEHQNAPLGDLLFDVPTLVADLSQIITLEPGDLIATGTPGGVGHAQGRYLQPGDEVVITIDGIGEISNTFKAPNE